MSGYSNISFGCFSASPCLYPTNRGFDVGPFVFILNQVKLDNFSYLVKLHTKRDIDKNCPYFRKMVGPVWRQILLNFIQTPKKFHQYLRAFLQNKRLGMQSDFRLIIQKDIYDKQAQSELNFLLKSKNLPIIPYSFVAGTMFVARADLFKNIQKLQLTLNDFPAETKQNQTQLAHVLERFFGYIVYLQGYCIDDSQAGTFKKIKYKLQLFYDQQIKRIVSFFFKKKITKSNKLCIKICKIPVYRKTVLLKKQPKFQ